MSHLGEKRSLVDDILRNVSGLELDLFPFEFSAHRTRLDIEEKLKSSQDGSQLLDEALEIAIQHGGNLDTLRRKVLDKAKLEQIISFFDLKSNADFVDAVTMSRLQVCFPERAIEVSHRLEPRLLSRNTPEAFPYAMRNDGFSSLVRMAQDQDLVKAYGLYKAQRAAVFDKLRRGIVDREILQTQMKFIEKGQCLEQGHARLVWNRKYGIYKENGELADVLRDMAAEYKRIMST